MLVHEQGFERTVGLLPFSVDIIKRTHNSLHHGGEAFIQRNDSRIRGTESQSQAKRNHSRQYRGEGETHRDKRASQV